MNHRPFGAANRVVGSLDFGAAGTPSAPRRLRVLHVITTLSAGTGENVRLTIKLLPRDHFQVFLAVRSGQSMESQVANDVTRLPVPHLVRPIRPSLAQSVDLDEGCDV